MRSPLCLLALALALAAPAVAAQDVVRPRVAVVVVTLDEARQGQIKHGREVIAALGRERFGRFELIESTIPPGDFRECEEDSPEYGLSFCVRFLLNRALRPDSPPHVVVAFTDEPREALSDERDGDMRALCFGRGAEPGNPKTQDIWLWTGSARMHGVNDWERDKEALAACIDAAMAEPPGEPRPRPS